jgi:hypothetical protein
MVLEVLFGLFGLFGFICVIYYFKFNIYPEEGGYDYFSEAGGIEGIEEMLGTDVTVDAFDTPLAVRPDGVFILKGSSLLMFLIFASINQMKKNHNQLFLRLTSMTHKINHYLSVKRLLYVMLMCSCVHAFMRSCVRTFVRSYVNKSSSPHPIPHPHPYITSTHPHAYHITLIFNEQRSNQFVYAYKSKRQREETKEADKEDEEDKDKEAKEETTTQQEIGLASLADYGSDDE